MLYHFINVTEQLLALFVRFIQLHAINSQVCYSQDSGCSQLYARQSANFCLLDLENTPVL